MFNADVTRVFKADKTKTKPLVTTAHQDSIQRSAMEEQTHQRELKSEDPRTQLVAKMRDESNDRLAAIKESSIALARANPTSFKVQKYEEEAYCASMELHIRAAPKKQSSQLYHPVFTGDTRITKAEDGKHNPFNLPGMNGEPYHQQMTNIHRIASEFAVGVKKSAHEHAMQAHQEAIDYPSVENSITANLASASRLVN